MKREDSQLSGEKGSSRVVNARATAYLQASQRPLIVLAFVLPMILLYEFGVIALGSTAIRNGADVWLRRLLSWIGFGQYFLLPVLVIAILLAWHHTRQDPWKIELRIVRWMWLESIAFGSLLLAIAFIVGGYLAQLPSTSGSTTQVIARMIGYLGAGLYEELMFRLLLYSATYGLLCAARLRAAAATFAAVVITSLLFAAAHYRFDFEVLGYRFHSHVGDYFAWKSFIFRTLAGGYFAILFAYRGFGIAVGAHAIYDVLVALVQD